ncbi:ExeA family protein [Calycomorphotria hydatis]|uniref:NACHT domain-containing protein n=1 Tax=Calycomorphotria hydatis TaxID=2528027 RepID=A0A517TBZ7_9PLAN|nr:NACHT domain-containing protein [Calycomorphotria hydatis]QDT65898.1 hypothetical protein V22_31610 [Calycomorphotria hydatis]
MYCRYWSLERPPFPDYPQPDTFYCGPVFEEALARIYFLIEQMRGYGVLSGQQGMGKSHLLAVAAHQVRLTRREALVLQPLSELELWQQLAEGLRAHSFGEDLATTRDAVRRELAARAHTEQQTILFVDDADSSPELLQAVERLMRQLERYRPWVTTIVTVENHAASRPGLLGHALPIELRSLSRPETERYLRYRLSATGREGELFTPDAFDAMHRLTGGLPSGLNRLADTSLLIGYSQSSLCVDAQIIEQAAREIGLRSHELAYDLDTPTLSESAEITRQVGVQ